MTKHYNPSISTDAARILNSKAGDFLSDEVQGLMAVIPIQTVCDVIVQNASTNADTTVFTTPTNKDFYLCGACLSVAKDATSTSLFTHLSVTVGGAVRNVLSICGLSSTAQQQTISHNFTPPIKIDRGTQIIVDNNTNAANIRSGACIWGYTVEVVK